MTSKLALAGSCVSAFILCWAGLRLLLLPRARQWFLDRPNHRSLHVNPIPRIGGVAMIPAALLTIALWAGYREIVLLTALLTVMSLLDDWRHLAPSARLLGHLAAALALVWTLLPDLPLVFVFGLAIAVAWITNLFNFMDGADGLAGGMALIGFGAYAAVAGATHPLLGAAALAVCGAAGAFLLFNFPPARVFMGDAGSIPLGFLAASLGPRGLACGPVAAVVSDGGVRSVRGRCQRHVGAPDRQRGACLGSASQPLLSALDPQRLDAPAHRTRGICAHAALRSRCDRCGAPVGDRRDRARIGIGPRVRRGDGRGGLAFCARQEWHDPAGQPAHGAGDDSRPRRRGGWPGRWRSGCASISICRTSTG